MKNKLYQIIILASLLSSVSCQAAEAPPSTTINLGGSEEKTYPVPREEALKSGMLSSFVRQFPSGQENIVPLEQFSNEILAKVASIMNFFYIYRTLHDRALLDAVENAVHLPQSSLIDLVKAFDYLDYEPGQNLIIRAISRDKAAIDQFMKIETRENLKPLVAHYYYLLKGTNLPGIDENSYGFSIQDYLDYQRETITRYAESGSINLGGERINNLYGLDRLPNKTQWNTIDLSDNQIREIPADWQEFSNLIRLDLSKNQIKEIAENWQMLQLEELDLDNNQISAIPVNWQMPQLQVLKLAYNQISVIPIGWQMLQLNQLFLEDNKISIMPSNWQMPRLALINLNLNQLNSIPANLNLPHLNTLNLSINPISDAEKQRIRAEHPGVYITF